MYLAGWYNIPTRLLPHPVIPTDHTTGQKTRWQVESTLRIGRIYQQGWKKDTVAGILYLKRLLNIPKKYNKRRKFIP